MKYPISERETFVTRWLMAELAIPANGPVGDMLQWTTINHGFASALIMSILRAS